MNDSISRRDAINAVHKAGITEYDETLAIEEIEMVPPAEPERKKGKWIFYETENERYDDIKCPFCKKTYTVDAYRIDDIGFTAEDFKFCPNCGAEMKASGKE